MRFLPDGSKAYISGGSNGAPSVLARQPILVVDVKTRSVVDLIYPDFDQPAMFIDIAPNS